MGDTIRWGVLGAAKFARDYMARAIHAAEGATLAALATSDPAKAAPFAAFAPGLRVHRGYDALLADPDVDAVYIPLPNHLHVEWTKKAIAAGKHVLCEKPLCLKAAEFDALIALRDQSGVQVAEAFMIVHHPQWQRARALLAEGAIGRLVHVHAAFTYDNASDPGNIRNQAEMGGGSVPDIGVYTMGSTRFVTGEEPTRVSSKITREDALEVTAVVDADFPGFTYTSYTSMRMNPFQEVVFHGTEGVMRLDAPFNAGTYGEARIELRQGERTIRVEKFSADLQYVLQVRNF
ncbi:MAG: Gfo/Idh/MocA family oxidoreductase, partial [Pseudomonadota bacterium]